jgi:hypothetical protein
LGSFRYPFYWWEHYRSYFEAPNFKVAYPTLPNFPPLSQVYYYQISTSSEIFLRNSHQNSHSREKKKTAFWGGL